jgi:nitrogen fixation protein FixH
MNTTSSKAFVFTGWHMAAVIVLFFGTIISVNFYMAYQAFTSWSGFVVENTYVASQQFNGKVAEARALAATGVTGKLTVAADSLRYDITAADGTAMPADRLILNFKRPVGEHQDFQLELTPAGEGVFTAKHQILPGHWIVEAIAEGAGRRILHHAERISVHGAKK